MGKDDLLNDDLVGVVDDDQPDVDDVDIDDGDEQDIDLEDIIAELSVDDDSEEDEADEEEEKADADDETEEVELSEDDKINQRVTAELNRIIPERLRRDRKTKQVQELEHITGMTLEQIKAQVIENAVQDTAERMGISEEEAREIVAQKYENASLKTEKVTKAQEEAEVNEAMQQVNYMRDKLAASKKPKLSRILTQDVVAEIDAFTQQGKILTFEDGMKYVLGSKLATGDLINKVQAGAEQKAKRTASTRKSAPQNRSGGPKSSSVGTLTRQEKLIAANLGISEKDYAAEKIAESNKKRRKGR